MANNNDSSFSMSDLKAALVKNDEADKKSIGNELDHLSPVVIKRVEALKQIQGQRDELNAKFLEEKASLEAKYQKLYEPLYSKRYDIVHGIVEAEGVTKIESHKEKGIEKGVPDFWLTAIKNNEIVGEELSERDEGAVKYLKDIKYSKLENEKGFKLEFFFDTNPYFKNTILTKTYHLIDEEDETLDRIIGTEVEWYTGKCLTKKTLRKKPKKGLKDAKPVTKTEKCASFFNFFDPPKITKIEDIDQDTLEELQNTMDYDYDIGATIRDSIIPNAVLWFTGEAEQEYGDFYDDDEDVVDIALDGGEEDGDDNDEDEYEEVDEDEDEKAGTQENGGP